MSIEGKKPSKLGVVSPPEEVIPWGIEWMGAPAQWDTNTGKSIKVAIIDTGIDLNHQDLKVNIKGGFNAFQKKKAPNDISGHGTHLAGIFAAARNGVGVVGVAPDAELYAVKVLDSSVNGYVSNVIEGINWCIKNKINIANMSFGMQSSSNAMHDIIIQADKAGIKMVTAAGNNYGGTALYPAAYPEVISVGAIDKPGNVADFSVRQNVDIFAYRD